MFASKEWETFFKNKNLVMLVDALAERYGTTPIEILDMPLYEFNLATAILVFAKEEERKQQEEAMEKYNQGKGAVTGKSDWGKMGISRTVKKAEKVSKGKKKEISHGNTI